MLRKFIEKIKYFIVRAWVFLLIVSFTKKAFAIMQTEYGIVAPIQMKYGVPQPLYGIQPMPSFTPKPIPTDYPQILYGPPLPTPFPPESITAEKILVYLIIPLVILVVFIVGTIVYLKRKKKDEHSEKDIQKRGS